MSAPSDSLDAVMRDINATLADQERGAPEVNRVFDVLEATLPEQKPPPTEDQRARAALLESADIDPEKMNRAVREGPISIPPTVLARDKAWPQDDSLAKAMETLNEYPVLKRSLLADPELAGRMNGGGWARVATSIDDWSPYSRFKKTMTATGDQFSATLKGIELGWRAQSEILDSMFGTKFSGRYNRARANQLLREQAQLQHSAQGLYPHEEAIAFGVGMLPHTGVGLASRAVGAATAFIPYAGPTIAPYATAIAPIVTMGITEGGQFFWDMRANYPEMPADDVAMMAVLVGAINGSLEQMPLNTALGSMTGQASRAARKLLADRKFRDLALHAGKRMLIQSGTEGFTEFTQELGPVAAELALKWNQGEITADEAIAGMVSPEAMERYRRSAYLGAIGAPVVGGVSVAGGLISGKRQIDQAKAARAAFQQIADTSIENADLIAQMPERYKQMLDEATGEDGVIEGVFVTPLALAEAYPAGSAAYNALFENIEGLAQRISQAEAVNGKVRFSPGEFATFIAGAQEFNAIADNLSFTETQRSLNEAREFAKPENLEALQRSLEALRESLETDPVENSGIEETFREQLAGLFEGALPAVAAPVREQTAAFFSRALTRVAAMDGQDPLDLMAGVLDRLRMEQRPELDSPAEVERSQNLLRGNVLRHRDATSVEQAISEAIRSSDYTHFGIRIDDDASISVGDLARESREHVEFEPTDNYLGGTSVIEIVDGDVGGALQAIAAYRHLGKRLMLVGGHDFVVGNDPGEVIMFDGEILSIVDDDDQPATGSSSEEYLLNDGAAQSGQVDALPSRDATGTRGQLIVDRAIQKFLLQVAEGSVNDSTLLHEMAHLTLEIVLDVAGGPNASAEIQGYAQDVLGFLGVESRDQITNKHHERWAESWEVYFAKGEAPTRELQGMFDFFMQRLKQVYRSIRDTLLNADHDLTFVPLFDKLLASEDEMRAEASRDMMMSPLVNSELYEMMTQDERDEIMERLRAVQASERSRLEKQIAREDAKQIKAQRTALAEEIKDEVFAQRAQRVWHWIQTGKTEVGPEIEMRNQVGMKIGWQKLSADGIDALLGTKGEFTRRDIPRVLVTKTGGLPPALVAAQFGYNSAEEMLLEIATAEAPRAMITRRVAVEAEQRGLTSSAEELQDAARRKVDWSARDRLYDAERRILSRLRGISQAAQPAARRGQRGQTPLTAQEAREAVRVARQALEDAIAAQVPMDQVEALQASVVAAEAVSEAAKEKRADVAAGRRNLPPRPSARQIRDTARKVVDGVEFRDLRKRVTAWKNLRGKAVLEQVKAAVAHDMDAVEAAIDQEQLANAMAEAGRERLEDVKKWRRDLKNFGPKANRRIRMSKHANFVDENAKEGTPPTNVMEMIDGLLGLVSFENVPLKRLDYAQWISRFNERVEEQTGIQLPIPEWAEGLLETPNYKTMTIGQLEELWTAVKALETFGLNLARDAEEDALTEYMIEMTELRGIEEQAPFFFADKQHLGATQGSKLKSYGGKFMGSQLSFETIADLLDDMDPEGPYNRYFVQRFQAAQQKEKSLRRMVADPINRAWQKLTPKQQRDFANVNIRIESLNDSLTMNEILGIAAMMGNEHSRKALEESSRFPLTPQILDEILSHVDNAHADYLIATAEAIDLLWKPASEAEREINGVVPPKVEGDAWQLPSGRWMPGFYFPMQFNANLSEKAAGYEAREIGKGLMPAGGGAAMTKVGAMRARKQSSGGNTINTDFNRVVQRHVNSMAKDIAWRGTLIRANKQIRALGPELRRVLGNEVYNEIKGFLKRMSTPIREGDQGTPEFLLKIFRKARIGLGVSVMAWRFTQAAIQASGFVNAIPRVGGANILWGFQETFAAGLPWKQAAMYRELIPDLADRAESFDRDAQQEMLRLNAGRSMKAVEQFSMHWGYYLLGQIDTYTATAVAAGAMHQAMKGEVDGIAQGDREAAIRWAGKAVRRTQGSGNKVDLPSLLDSGEALKLLTPMMTYANTQFQQAVLFGSLAQRQIGDPTAPKSRVPGVPRDVARFLSFWFFAYLLEPLLSEGMRMMINGAMGPDEPDEERFFRTLRNRAILGPIGSSFGGRDIEGLAAGYDIGTTYGDLASVMYQAARRTGELFDPEEADAEKWIRAMADATTYATGAPTKQMIGAYEVLTQEAFGRKQR